MKLLVAGLLVNWFTGLLFRYFEEEEEEEEAEKEEEEVEEEELNCQLHCINLFSISTTITKKKIV